MKEKTEKDLERAVELFERTLIIFSRMATIVSLTEIRTLSEDINKFLNNMRQVWDIKKTIIILGYNK